MATRTLNVAITGDARDLNRTLDNVERHSRRNFVAIGKAAGVAGLAIAGGLAVGMKKSASAAIEAEKSQAKMVTQLKAAGVSYKDHAKQIDEVIQKTSKLSGLDDEDLQDSFTNIVRVTGDVNKSLQLTGLAADFARAKHMDVAKAGELVGKVAGGNTGILARYGIQIDKGATATEALGELHEKFKGQAEAYGKTTAGAMDRASVASENLGEMVGAKLTPWLAKAADAMVDVLEWTEKTWPKVRRVITDVIDGVRGAITRFVDKHKEAVGAIVGFVKNIGGNLRDAFGGLVDIITGIVEGDWKKAWGGAKRVAKNAIENLAQVIKLAWQVVGPAMLSLAKFMVRKLAQGLADVPGIVKGEINEIPPTVKRGWQVAGPAMESLGHYMVRRFQIGVREVPSIARDVTHAIPRALKAEWEFVGKAVLSLAKFIVRQLRYGITTNLPDALAESVNNGVKKGVEKVLKGGLSPIKLLGDKIGDLSGDGIGKKLGDGLGFLGGSAGKSGAGLDGADMDLAPFARIGASMGLRVSSGLRAGSITSSGNRSYHSSGDAIDMADGTPGPSPAKMRFFKAMRAMFGSRLRELIYTPGGIGIKDGRPYQYSGQVAADHYDHVHVAYTGPFGDGIGDIRNLWTRAGGRASAANMAAAIAMAESSGDPGAKNVNSDGSIDRGLWQINSVHGALSTFNRLGNAKAAVRISGNGRNWNPWVTFKTGAYRAFLSAAGGKGGGGGPHARRMSPAERFAQSQQNTADAADAAIRNAAHGAGGPLSFAELVAARARRRSGAVGTVGGGDGDLGGGSGENPDQPLIDAMAANTRALDEHKAALDSVGSELKRQTDLATSAMASDKAQLYKFVGDIMSGQIGRGIVGRSLTPGTGVEVAF